MARLSGWLPAAMCVALVLLLCLAAASAQDDGPGRHLMGSRGRGWSKGKDHQPDKGHPQNPLKNEHPPKNEHPEMPPKNDHPWTPPKDKPYPEHPEYKNPKVHIPDIKVHIPEVEYHGGKDWNVPDYKPDHGDWNKGHKPEMKPPHMGGNKGNKWH